MDWEPPETELEVRFAADGEATRVELEHRGFETYGPDGRASYDEGWDAVLGELVEATA